MKYDTTTSIKCAPAMIPASVDSHDTVAVSSTEIAIDTKGYESCNIVAFIGDVGNATDATGIPIAITESDASDTGFAAIDAANVLTSDATYASSAWTLDVPAVPSATLGITAVLDVRPTKRYLKVKLTNPAASSGDAMIASAQAVLSRPVYDANYFGQDAKPSQA